MGEQRQEEAQVPLELGVGGLGEGMFAVGITSITT